MSKTYKNIKNFYLKNRFFLNFLFLWILLFLGIRTVQHFSFRTNAFDLSIPDYMMYFTLKGELMCEPFHGYWGCHFAHHFTPILFFIVPFYLVFSGPLFLLYLQVFSGGLSAFLLYLIAKNEFDKEYIPTIISVTYLLYRPFLNGLMYDFHYEMFFPLFLFLSYYFVAIKKNYLLYFLFITLALFIKEDIAIFIFFFGVFLFFKPKSDKKIGLITAAYSLFYFITTMEIIIPYFRDQVGLKGNYGYFILWQDLGGSYLEIIKNLIIHPKLIFQSISWSTVIPKFFNIVSSLLFIPFFSSFVLLIIPPVFILATSKSPIMHGFGLHYIANILPFLFLGLIYGLKNIEKIFFKSKRHFKIFIMILVLLLAVNLANTKWNLLRISRYSSIKDYKTVKEFINFIPRDTSVAALSSLIPHIPKRKNIYMLPETNDAEYILIHTGVNLWPFKKEGFENFINKLSSQIEWTCIKECEKIKLYKKINHR